MIFLKDEEFIRGNCPMTKEEIRIISLGKMELREDYTVLDIGAGTGSVSIEIGRICKKGKVISIEKDVEALEVFNKNIEKFNMENITLIKGEAPECLDNITETFDSIFIGGSGGNIEDIIINCSNKLKSKGMMVLNFITIDNLYRGINTLKILKYEYDIVQISVNKIKGKSLMITSNNSIFILRGRKI